MDIKEFINSGIIEMYCMGLASQEEQMLVEKYAAVSREVRDEIISITEALNFYSLSSERTPPASLKNKILDAVSVAEQSGSQVQLPPRITLSSNVEEWMKYLSDNKINSPGEYDTFFVLDLPGDEKQVTYLAWAKKGASLEETHDQEDEYLLMLKGKCSVTINGQLKYYKEGDVIFIPASSLHCAEALSDEPMLLVGQRIAA